MGSYVSLQQYKRASVSSTLKTNKNLVAGMSFCEEGLTVKAVL